MNQKLRERMENEKQKLLNESDYQEGESCSYYMNEIGAFKTGFNKGAEWMHREEVVPLQTALSVAHEALLWADEMFTARDTMNAKVHCSPIRLSPITLRVKQALELIEKTKGGEG